MLSDYEQNRINQMTPAQLRRYHEYGRLSEEQHALEEIRAEISEEEFHRRFNNIVSQRTVLTNEHNAEFEAVLAAVYKEQPQQPERHDWQKEGF